MVMWLATSSSHRSPAPLAGSRRLKAISLPSGDRRGNIPARDVPVSRTLPVRSNKSDRGSLVMTRYANVEPPDTENMPRFFAIPTDSAIGEGSPPSSRRSRSKGCAMTVCSRMNRRYPRLALGMPQRDARSGTPTTSPVSGVRSSSLQSFEPGVPT